jgi:ABC-type proline/glycine betaine transport system substrate-binding protein
MKNEGADAEETAIWFLKEFPEEWKAWIPDEERIGRISEALRK